MAKAPPSFDFYHSDFIAGTSHMTPEEVGCYLRLLCYQWANGSIPRDKERLSRICVCSLESFNRAWPGIVDKFESADETGDRLVNRRMDSDRAFSIAQWEPRRKKRSQEEIAEIRRQAGLKGAESRWQNDGKKCDILEEKWQNDGKRMAKHGKREEGRGKKEVGSSFNTVGSSNRIDTQYGLENSKRTASDVGASNTEHEKEVDSEPDRFGTGNFDILGIDGSSNPKIDDKAAHASRNERKAPDQCPISTEPIQPAPESILRVQKKTPEIVPASKQGKLDGPAKVLFNDRVQTVILPKGLDTRRVERAVQRWVDYCLSMGKLPQVMALENQLQEVARANPKEDDFVHAINRTIANNCDPHNFKPRLWAREWVGTAARPQPEREPDKIYNTLEQCRAAGAI